MSISFNAIKPPDALTIVVGVMGDGTSTSLVIPLDLPPLNLDLKGNLPIGVTHVSFPISATASLSSDGKSVVLTFASAPPAPPNDMQGTFVLEFAGA